MATKFECLRSRILHIRYFILDNSNEFHGNERCIKFLMLYISLHSCVFSCHTNNEMAYLRNLFLKFSDLY